MYRRKEVTIMHKLAHRVVSSNPLFLSIGFGTSDKFGFSL